MPAADLSGNPRRWVLFTTFYNARAYYPVLAILFLDLGLKLDEFVLLNLVWAAAIFFFEVPSGALADTVGRKKLLVAAAILMVVEMSCLLLAPRNGGALLFGLCLLNRVCSGISEACASGADEALAYDSLPEENRADAWDRLLATAMRWRSAGFVIAMILGGLLYEPPAALGIPKEISHRLPVVIVLCQSLVCLFFACRMVEPPRPVDGDLANSCRTAVRLTLQTARWVFTNPHTLVVVVLGLSIDSVVRNFATITSTYYRLIGLEEWTFGFIGSAIGVIGWFIPAVAQRLNQRFSTLANFGIAAVAAIIGLAALVPMWPIYGLLPCTLLMTMMGYLGFTVSRALHREADSSQRATVLSVKGLAFNLGYGLMSLGFSRLLSVFPQEPEGLALRKALLWQLPFFVAALALLFIWAGILWKRGDKKLSPPSPG